jgi:hypothetical protein
MKWIPLAEWARRERTHWRNAYKAARQGRIRARSKQRGAHRAWEVAASETQPTPRRGPKPKRMSGPATARVNNPRMRRLRARASGFKRLP